MGVMEKKSPRKEGRERNRSGNRETWRQAFQRGFFYCWFLNKREQRNVWDLEGDVRSGGEVFKDKIYQQICYLLNE